MGEADQIPIIKGCDLLRGDAKTCRAIEYALKTYGCVKIYKKGLDGQSFTPLFSKMRQFFNDKSSGKTSQVLTAHALQNNRCDPRMAGYDKKAYQTLQAIANDVMRNLFPHDPSLREEFSQATNPSANRLRMLAYHMQGQSKPHTDYSLFTLVKGSGRGLDVTRPDGGVVNVRTETDEVLLMSGRALAVLTDNQFQATRHGFKNENGISKDRYSCIYFANLDDGFLLNTPRCSKKGQNPLDQEKWFRQGAVKLPISYGEFIRKQATIKSA